MLMEEITSVAFEKAKKEVKTVIFPVGSVEAHGPHLPLATDLYTIYEVCKKVSQKKKVLIAPPLYYGLCRSTGSLPGTISLTGEVLKKLMFNLFHQFYLAGFKNFMVLSGHAGGTHNAYLIDAAESFISIVPYCNFFVADIFQLLKPCLKELGIPEEDSHAGEWETSLMLYLRPDLVKEGGFEDYPKFPKFRIVSDKEKYWSTGIWGDPRKASLEKGKQMVDWLVQFLIKEIEKMEQELEEKCFL
ncbi:creatininase family protein [Thermodesulfobacterium sp. TA1]|uniref:creatininase family protein n=1 Tax=Thermodesulfobacterium sp. TA1 TaxID=2234087 RepID=UPI00123275C9|nr:creatininase family protein [Thermodesulfobacterium sp. TA1]QER41692.1 creatininase family protein [Thermodesulfobacterium sp. TA1]